MINGSAQFILPIIDLTAKSQKQRIEINFLSAVKLELCHCKEKRKLCGYCLESVVELSCED